ncbi:hypothetical protein MMC30_006685 [Trapelia coarctata]|nr:hypothetical protein [Trapelia coarctata]
MFDRIESEELATSLILGTSKDLDSSNGLCRSQINYVPTSGIGVAYFPEHCLELYGTPLHWAVRTRNLELVRLLVRLGADVHQFAFPSPPSDIGFSRLANLTPLGLAIVFHLPEITDFLIGHTYGKSKDRLQPDASMFTLLGRSCLPLSRYIIHGAEHRRALKQTIKSLVKHDACLEMVVRIGETSLMTEIFMESLAVTDQESYIPDELLFAGARVDGYTGNGDNAATVAVHDCALRRYSNTALRFVSAGGIDINMKNKHGYNALHYCSIHGSDGIMDAILRREDIDIDCTSTKGGYSALHLAAMFGSAEVIPVLIQGKATLELQNGAGYTALQTAVQNRRLAAAVALLRAGAETTFSNGESILHIAIKSTNRDTMIPQLLESYEELQHSKFTRAADKYGFCPLHTAAYVGDREGVRALLNHGARHNIFAKYRGPAKAKIPMRITALKMVEDVLSGERPGALLFGHFDSQKEPISNSYANPGHTGMQRRDKVAVRQYIADLQDIQQQLSRAAK